MFEEVARIYPPLLPICSDRSPAEELAAGAVAPSLAELKLHQSTVWLWNRPIYDDADGGHLRVEMRALPAGPTPIDMVANAAFLIGLAEGLRPQINTLLTALPFSMAEYNFYRAAQHGMNAELVWPDTGQTGYSGRPVVDIIRSLLPCAREGLDAIGIDRSESARYLAVIEQRLETGQNGSIWQQQMLDVLDANMPREEALHELLARFIANSTANLPVAEWSL